MSDLKLTLTSGSEQPVVQVPKFLQNLDSGFSLSGRPHLPVDDVEEDGTAKDTVKHRPSYKYKTYKRVERKLQDLESWVKFIQDKRGNN